MKKRYFLSVCWLMLVAIILVACGGDTSTPTPTETAVPPTAPPAPETGLAPVESIQLLIMESFPVQVSVMVRGELPDNCTQIDRIETNRTNNQFNVAISTLRDASTECTDSPVPFEETIPLDVENLDAGTYTVSVNGITGSFTLDVDNRIPEETDMLPTPTPEPAAAINGRVWHDLCAVTGGEGEEETTPSEGCVANPDGSFQANGIMEDGEPGIAEVIVSLGAGECPSDGLTTAVTDEDGTYTFTTLAPGTYCVSVNPLIEANSDILLPGSWTFPAPDTNTTTVTLAAGEIAEGINFGWDYQFLPIPDVDPATCTNSIEFVEDISIPDDTVLAPGQEFTKVWRLRNNGTCPWTTEYSLVFVGGDEIPGPQSVPLESPVAPGQTVDLSVTLTAPAEPGTYRANWQIANAAGEPFGVNGLIEEAFWVQIVVEEGVDENAPGTIGGIVWEDICRIQADGTPTVGCVETAENSGFFRADGTLNFNEPPLAGITVTLSQGPCPDTGVIAPSSVVATAVTDEDGLYRFFDVEPGLYCVSIDAFSEENVDLLIPGDWTWPAPGVGRIGVILDPGEEQLAVDFGWDYDD
ncbi:MAG: hypothetical protein D6706_17290 [Chloroflexi bacterium]|nr:MAG: hypothetical protein D6706_17290 [Chloroflexota bacterium]